MRSILLSLVICSPVLSASAQDGQAKKFPDIRQSKGLVTYIAPIKTRGSSVPIKISHVERLCGDKDGCQLRLGMFNWDTSGRVGSRSATFYYNKINKAWRTSYNDSFGSDANGTNDQVMKAWACYFVDGEHDNFVGKGDGKIGFNLLSWNDNGYVAECRLTIVD